MLAELIVAYLLAPGTPITVVVDDTLFRRRGKKVHGVGWFHDGSAVGQVKLGFGNNWVVVAIVVTLPYSSRPAALPVLATLERRLRAGLDRTPSRNTAEPALAAASGGVM
jgi:DDE superfamily endonuclease